MKLWLLKPVEGLPDDLNPWKPWYDKAFAFIVRAENEDTARFYASTQAGEESDHKLRPYCERINPWLWDNYSTCEELSGEGEHGVIVRDFRSS